MQIIWGAIWQLPPERNAKDSSERIDRTDRNDRKNMIDIWGIYDWEIREN